jgi:glycosyltransferase involved in cell wall biosynthesis
MQINQFIPSITPGDAVSNDALAIRSILRKNGYKSIIYAKFIHPRMLPYARPYFLYRGSKENILIYHFAVGGLKFSDFILNLPDFKILKYHNITPPEYFENYDAHSYFICQQGLNELSEFKDHFNLGVGDSPFNCLSLKRVGFNRTFVLPILIDFSKYARYNETLENMLKSSNSKKIIFVGRIAPNKKQEDVIKAFNHYQKKFNPFAMLYLIGKKQIKPYLKELEELIQKLDLSNNIIFTGKISESELNTYYRNADVFVCMSEHEGFCVPLVESMFFNIPIIAYDSSAIKDTLVNAGILFQEKNFEVIAQNIHKVLEDALFREQIIDKQKVQLVNFQVYTIEQRLMQIIGEIHSLKNLKMGIP